jgi:hypothetical protein
MPAGPDDDDRDQTARINALKQQAEQAARGKMVAWESDAPSPDVEEQFWRQVLDLDAAPVGTDFRA